MSFKKGYENAMKAAQLPEVPVTLPPVAQPQRGIVIPLTIFAHEKVGTVGKAMAVCGAEIGKLITNEFAQNRKDYDIDITITMKEKDNS